MQLNAADLDALNHLMFYGARSIVDLKRKNPTVSENSEGQFVQCLKADDLYKVYMAIGKKKKHLLFSYSSDGIDSNFYWLFQNHGFSVSKNTLFFIFKPLQDKAIGLECLGHRLIYKESSIFFKPE